MPKWTEAQQRAIDTDDRNIMVSAAAGSGKTAVLVERIKRLIISDKADIDGFLVTTFTKAAASEMKQRLEAAVREEMEKPDADRKFLLRQLRLLPAAAIGTFHSFASDIIRRYFYLTDLEPGFKIADDVQATILKRRAADELFERGYEEGGEDFRAFLIKYGSDRSDRRIKENIIKTYENLRSIPHYMEWARERTELLRSKSPLEAMGIADFIAGETAGALKEAAGFYEEAARLLDAPGLRRMYDLAAGDAAGLRRAAEEAGDPGAIRKFLKAPGFNRMIPRKDEREAYLPYRDEVSALRKEGKKRIDELKKKYYIDSFEEYDRDLNAVYEDSSYFIGLIGKFEEGYSGLKNNDCVIDFDDVMHYAIRILEDERAAGEQRERFRYIFVDEYQDGNMLQETIIRRIAAGDNLFTVGDVKQSIYRFRLADPEIFTRRALSYKDTGGEAGLLISLNSNFRSKSNVTDTVNAVFREIMPDYDEDAALCCMADKKHPGSRTGLHIIDREARGDAAGNDAEAEAIAGIIRDCVGSEIFDDKLDRYRPVEFRDIAVLSRAAAAVTDIERYLNNENIPAYGEAGEGYFESVEIQVFINLLKAIDNTRQDVPLISVMRSVVFGFSFRQMAEIRINRREGSFYSAVKEYAESGSNAELRGRIEEMERKLGFWKEAGKALPLDEFLRMLLYDTGYYDYCSGLPVGRQRISNLRLIVEKAARFEERDHGGLHGFLTYVEAMADSRVSEAEAKTAGEAENVVRVMTVHKSKGLEFPVVILAGAGRRIRGGGPSAAMPLHKDFGIGLPLIDSGQRRRRKTLLQKAIAAKTAREGLDEEVRILYVAMTRARDRLEIVGAVRRREDLKDAPSTGSYIDMTYAALDGAPFAAPVDHVKPGGTEIAGRGPGGRAEDLLSLMADGAAGGTSANRDEIYRRLDFEYPYGAEAGVRTKYSVTELSGRGRRAVPIAEFEPDRSKHRLTAAEAGTAMHLVMERMDFAKARDGGVKYVEDFADSLLDEGSISADERRAIGTDAIAAFFEDDIGRRAAEAFAGGRLRREREFIMQRAVDGVPAVVQGVIDCWFEEEGGLVLIDYKNSHMGGGRTEKDIRERYGEQMDIYAEALEAATGQRIRASYIYLFELKKFIETG